MGFEPDLDQMLTGPDKTFQRYSSWLLKIVWKEMFEIPYFTLMDQTVHEDIMMPYGHIQVDRAMKLFYSRTNYASVRLSLNQKLNLFANRTPGQSSHYTRVFSLYKGTKREQDKTIHNHFRPQWAITNSPGLSLHGGLRSHRFTDCVNGPSHWLSFSFSSRKAGR